MWWVFRNYSIFLPHRPNLVLLVALDILPFSLIKQQVVTCILWCLVRICSNQLHIQGRQFCSKWFQYNHLSCPSVIDFAWMVQMAAGIAQFWSGFVKCLVDIYLAIWKREETQFDLLRRFHGVRLDWNQCHGWVLVWTHPWHWFRSNLWSGLVSGSVMVAISSLLALGAAALWGKWVHAGQWIQGRLRPDWPLLTAMTASSTCAEL